ncbi:exo-beta-N-acetylmuramidase NamZ domain-containing protein [Tamlana fucoidanivorans]|nr:DUF1343 domain-containing protein [Tamlana fucoidanivorans]
MVKNTVLLFVLAMISCASKMKHESSDTIPVNNKKTHEVTPIIVGANQTATYLPLLQTKRIGIVANQTSVIFKTNHQYTHLVDSLIDLNINVKKVFAPEHGFRGQADAGEAVKDGIDTKTNLPIISLYGKNKKPSESQLADLDLVIFDIQDVGARFYTYISSLHYVMEACAEQDIPVLILDRPNPNGHYIDGPVLKTAHKSFVGMHPIPVVHGMTIGEYAKMINGEGWLANSIKCSLHVIPVKNYNRQLPYILPIKPSPNLPNDQAINLYPSLCFFEGTNVNAGRGTETQFQVFGSPYLNPEKYTFQYTPQSNTGSKYPKHQGKVCFGKDVSQTQKLNALNLTWLIEAYKDTSDTSEFFNTFFTKLAGTTELQKQIELGLSEQSIKDSWKEALNLFKTMRSPYLIYL